MCPLLNVRATCVQTLATRVLSLRTTVPLLVWNPILDGLLPLPNQEAEWKSLLRMVGSLVESPGRIEASSVKLLPSVTAGALAISTWPYCPSTPVNRSDRLKQPAASLIGPRPRPNETTKAQVSPATASRD